MRCCIGAVVKSVTLTLAVVVPSSALVETIDTLGDVSLVAGAAVLAYRLFVVTKRRLLWRVRRRLTLSYIFIGFVPALLIITFFLLCGVLVVLNLSSYLMQMRVRAVVDQAQFLAQAAALELQRAPDAAARAETLQRRQAAAASRYPAASYAVIPVDRGCDTAAPSRRDTARPVAAPVTAGPWAHLDPPSTLPSWVSCAGYAGLSPTRKGRAPRGWPCERWRSRTAPGRDTRWWWTFRSTTALAHQLRDDTGTELGPITVVATNSGVRPLEGRPVGERRGRAARVLGHQPPRSSSDRSSGSRSSTIATGTPAAPVRSPPTSPTSVAGVYDRISPPSMTPIRNFSFGQMLLVLLGIIGGLFLVIQVVAFGMGLALARSITGSVHELFAGTERVRQGDFTHKIPISTRDQLGDLAESFNSMTASIEDLLQQKAEKERLEQELRIARDIQMSLLPQGPLRMPGLSLTGHCEPAREVGGDYYDFLPLDEQRLGRPDRGRGGKGDVRRALHGRAEGRDVLAQPASPLAARAAHRRQSDHLAPPRQEQLHHDHLRRGRPRGEDADLRARRALPAHLHAGSLCARRGRCRFWRRTAWCSGSRSTTARCSTRLLEEVTVPLGQGDLFVLYTDGITEAMNAGRRMLRRAAAGRPHRAAGPLALRRAARAHPEGGWRFVGSPPSRTT